MGERRMRSPRCQAPSPSPPSPSRAWVQAQRLAEYKPHIGVKHLMGNLQRVQQIVDDAIQAFNATRMKIISYEEVVRSPKVRPALTS